MSEEEFELRVGRSGSALVVAPRGELDLATTPELARALSAAAGEDVLVDLREVSFIDSSGISGLLEGWRGSQEAGGRLRAVAGPPQVQRVVALVALDRTLEWADPPVDVTWLTGPD